jgi:hypothetical protein
MECRVAGKIEPGPRFEDVANILEVLDRFARSRIDRGIVDNNNFDELKRGLRTDALERGEQPGKAL